MMVFLLTFHIEPSGLCVDAHSHLQFECLVTFLNVGNRALVYDRTTTLNCFIQVSKWRVNKTHVVSFLLL